MSSANWIKSGRAVGTGAVIKVTTGFKPRKVELINDDSFDQATKLDSMPDDEAHKRIAAGTGTSPTGVCTLLDDGFEIGTDSDINVAGENIDWIAYQADNN